MGKAKFSILLIILCFLPFSGEGADKIAEAELIYKQLIDIKHVQRECRKRMVIKHFENLWSK